MYMLIGFLVILAASLLETFCAFGRDAMPEYKPRILKTRFRWVLEVLWVLLLLTGGVLLLIDTAVSGSWLYFIISIAAFWLVLPFLYSPIVRKRFLPHWDDVKQELGRIGLTQYNYLRNDWWKIESKRKKRKQKTTK